MVHSMPLVHQLYSKYLQGKRIHEGKAEKYVMELWGDIPATIGQAAQLLSK